MPSFPCSICSGDHRAEDCPQDHRAEKFQVFHAPTDIPQKLDMEYLKGKYVLCPHCNQLMAIEDVGPRQEGIDPSDGQAKGYFMLTLSDGGTARMWETM